MFSSRLCHPVLWYRSTNNCINHEWTINNNRNKYSKFQISLCKLVLVFSTSSPGRKLTPAFPASIRWTAPEILRHPTSDEATSNIYSPACDVYSFGMTIWEAMNVADPWFDIADEENVSYYKRKFLGNWKKLFYITACIIEIRFWEKRGFFLFLFLNECVE